MRKPLDALVTQRVLHAIDEEKGKHLVELTIESGGEPVPLKNVCAKVTEELSDRIDTCVSILGCSKRRFLESAFIEAVIKTEEILSAEGYWDVVSQHQPPKLEEVA